MVRAYKKKGSYFFDKIIIVVNEQIGVDGLINRIAIIITSLLLVWFCHTK